MTNAEKLTLAKHACHIRMGVIEGTHSAKCGHPGGSLDIAEVLAYLYFVEMKVDPKDPKNPDRDRLVLSKGHAAPALYAALAPHNALDCPAGADAMIYPFLCRVDGLRGRLIKNKVYVSQWWKYLLELLPADSVEADYSRYLLPLPIDQRYTPDDMRALAALVLQLKEEGEPA